MCVHVCACRWDINHKKTCNHGEGLKTKLQNGGMLQQRTEGRGESEKEKKEFREKVMEGK